MHRYHSRAVSRQDISFTSAALAAGARSLRRAVLGGVCAQHAGADGGVRSAPQARGRAAGRGAGSAAARLRAPRQRDAVCRRDVRGRERPAGQSRRGVVTWCRACGRGAGSSCPRVHVAASPRAMSDGNLDHGRTGDPAAHRRSRHGRPPAPVLQEVCFYRMNRPTPKSSAFWALRLEASYGSSPCTDAWIKHRI